MTEVRVAGLSPVEVDLEPGQYYFCTCGRSENQPFCDGSHKGTDLKPLAFEVAMRERCYLCTCKQTADAPYCDGSHNDLDED